MGLCDDGNGGVDQVPGTLLGMDMKSKAPVYYDRFGPEVMNAHILVMGGSDAEKSFFIKLMVLREVSMGVPVYLVDARGEYGALTRALGGRVLELGSPDCGLNPFAVRYTREADLTVRILSLCSLVAVMVGAREAEDLRVVIDRCLTGFYLQELRRDGDPGVLGSGGMTAFHQYLESKDALESGGARLAYLLSPFVMGSARFLMGKGPVDLLESGVRVTAFDVRNLAGPLEPAVASVCLEMVWGMAVAGPRPRSLVVDECMTVLGVPSGAELLTSMVRRSRKFQLGFMVVTREVRDFLGGRSGAGLIGKHPGRSLLHNSAMKLVFSQEPAVLGLVMDVLGLDEDAGHFLAGVRPGQAVLVGDSGNVCPIEIVPTQVERDLIGDGG